MIREFYTILIVVRTLDGQTEEVALTNDLDDHSIEIDGVTRVYVARHNSFSVPTSKRVKGTNVHTTSVRFTAHPEFDRLITGYNLTGAPFYCHRVRSLQTGEILSVDRWITGFIEGAPLRDMRDRSIRLVKITSVFGVEGLTGYAGKKSHADQQRRHAADRALEYSGVGYDGVGDKWSS